MGHEESQDVLHVTIGSLVVQLVDLLVLGVRFGSQEVWVMHPVMMRMRFLTWVGLEESGKVPHVTIGSLVAQLVHMVLLGVRLGSLEVSVMHLVLMRMMFLTLVGQEECQDVLNVTIGSLVAQLVHLVVLEVRFGSLEVWVMHPVMMRTWFLTLLGLEESGEVLHVMIGSLVGQGMPMGVMEVRLGSLELSVMHLVVLGKLLSHPEMIENHPEASDGN